MAIKSEKIDGTKIINEVESSNLSKTEYDTATKKMLVTFKNGLQYEYEDVTHQTYTRFRMSESQGKYFSTEIAKKHKFTKLSQG